MTLTHITIAGGLALLYNTVLPARLRQWALLIASVIAVYWLSPALPIRGLDFILPTLTLLLAGFIWLITRPAGVSTDAPAEAAFTREDGAALLLTGGLVVALSATRYLAAPLRPTPSRAPDVLAVLIGLLVAVGVMALLWRLLRGWPPLLNGVILFIVVLFAFLKAEPLTVAAASGLRGLTGQPVDLARVTDISWLGFSYVAFRLIHMIRERQTGKLPGLNLREALTYVIFFPALTAGPIDRAERFVKDDRALPEQRALDPARIIEGLTRIMVGIFKKFVIADSLALLALNAQNAAQVETTGGLWVLLYAYSFRLYLDFAGYSDIAIGIGLLFGVRLPENFNLPYLKQNLAQFWQSWHITLSNWVRYYVFSPFSRALMLRKPRPHPLLIVFSAQMITMLVIGLWHGASWTFVIWGVWHGVGLFVHKWWSDRTRKWYLGLKDTPRRQRAVGVFGVLLTFHYVTLGWVWFALPEAGLALETFLRLFGVGA